MKVSAMLAAVILALAAFALPVQAQPLPDTTAPVISSVTASPAIAWPPNHKMVLVTVSADLTDDTDPAPTWEIISITSDEPVDATDDPEDGEIVEVTTPDWEILSDTTANVRAERLGKGDGRVYTITIQASDASGNTSTADVKVYVPHDQGKMKKLLKQQLKLERKQQKEDRKNDR